MNQASGDQLLSSSGRTGWENGVMAANDLTFHYKWQGLGGEGAYSYPMDPRAFLSKKREGIYCWRIVRNQAAKIADQLLIGESADLGRRLHEYVRPTTDAERGWRRLFLKEVEDGAEITCQLLTFEWFTINSAPITPQYLRTKLGRLLIESMVVLCEQTAGFNILNKDRTPWERVGALA
jgi:hypothetical protein